MPSVCSLDLSAWSSAGRDPLAAPELLPLIEAVGRVLLGKEPQVRLALSCVLAGGHLLIEDCPGMGKSTLAEALARVFALAFKRVSFSSDLLPADLTGLNVFNPGEASFRFQPGPPVPFSVGSVAAFPGPSGSGASAGGKLFAPLSSSREDAPRSGHPVEGDGGSAAAACPCPAHPTPAPAASAPMAATPHQACPIPLN